MAAIQPVPRKKRPTTGKKPIGRIPEELVKNRTLPKMPGKNKPVPNRPTTGPNVRIPTPIDERIVRTMPITSAQLKSIKKAYGIK